MTREKKVSIDTGKLDGAMILSVPNGMAMAEAGFADLVEKYRGSLRKTAEGIIEVARTLVEAKKRLPSATLSDFCKEIGMTNSTFKKWVKIGECAARFESVIDRTPPTWTTMYPIANLSEDQFERVKKDERFRPEMSQKELTLIVNGPSQEQIGSLPRDVTLDLGNIDRAKKIEACRKLGDIVREYGLRYKIGSQLEKELMSKQRRKDLLENLPA